MRVRRFAMIVVFVAACLVGARGSAAGEQLTIVMDRDYRLYVSTALDSGALRKLSFGLERDGIRTFTVIDDDALRALATAAFRHNSATNVTVWVDPSARPLAWPEGWPADSDLLDPAAYLQMLLRRAREQAGVRDVLPWQAAFINLAFPPPTPQRIGSHSRTPSKPQRSLDGSSPAR